MSYHILHQFDEQWFGEEDNGPRHGQFFRTHSGERNDRTKSRVKSVQRAWLVTILSLIVAASALYFAMDARKQTAELQQRISELELRLKR